MPGEDRDSKVDESNRTVVVDRHQGSLPFGKIALIGAAVIALVAIGVSVWKSRADAPAATATSEAPGGDIDARLAELEAKAKANPRDAELQRRLGWAYYGLERFQDSAAAYRRATAIDPKNVDSWSALGEALALASPTRDVTPEAVAAFRKAVALDPADPRARYFLGVKKDLDGDHKGAIDDWIAILKDTPAGGAPWEDAVRQTILQVAQQNKIDIAGRLPQAKGPPPPDASSATAAIPGPTPQQMQAASSLPPGQQDAMVQGMVDSLAAKLKADPKNADGWLRMMRARMVLGQQSEATRAYKDATTAFPGDAATLGRLKQGAQALGVPGV